MYAARYVFSRGFFVAWAAVSIVWVWGTMLIASLYPVVDGRAQIRLVCRRLLQRGWRAWAA